jgi:hypothetical protein
VKRSVYFVLSLAVLSPASFAAAPGPQPSDDAARLQRTLKAVRDVGVAGFSWLTDKIGDDPNLEEGRSIVTVEGATLDWSQCPLISHSDLVKILVPNFIYEVPSVDGWGNPLEFCLNRKNLLTHSYVLGVRSSGRDGKFESGSFKKGSFDPTDFDRDVVWLDGEFVAWPKGVVPAQRLPFQQH